MSTVLQLQCLPESLETFYGKLLTVLDGGNPPLSRGERLWLLVFNLVADRFSRLTRDESFALSFDALRRCHHRGNAGYYRYLRRACINAHHDFLPASQPRYRRLRHEPARDPWLTIDARLDLADALVKLDQDKPAYARAIRLQLAGYSRTEMAKDLGVCERQAVRILRQAEACLRGLLGESDE